MDKERQLVYFHANVDTPLETHLYVVSYTEGVSLPTATPQRLTEAGFSHNVVMRKVGIWMVLLAMFMQSQPHRAVYKSTSELGTPL